MTPIISNYLTMGGYAAFVWPAYGVAASIMIGLWFSSASAYRRNRRALDRLQQERPDRRRGAR
jgi:heme exporter protein D